jgi:hypothetical protein
MLLRNVGLERVVWHPSRAVQRQLEFYPVLLVRGS